MRTLTRCGIRWVFGVGLLTMAVFMLPGFAGAQNPPPVFCKERQQLNNFITQCVVDTLLWPLDCLNWCPGHLFPPIGGNACWPTLDDAVNAPRQLVWEPLLPAFPHVPPDPQPARTIGVFGPTIEDSLVFKLVRVFPANDNVLINDPAFAVGWLPPGPYPLVIQECHNAKINAGGNNGPALPVIEVLNASAVNPIAGVPVPISVGPVTINSLEVIGGSEGILVGTKINPTTLKAIDANGMFIGIEVTGNKNEVSGSVTDANNYGIFVSGDTNLIRSNRAEDNLFDGFQVTGTGNQNNLRGNTANNNGAFGFDIQGNGNIVENSNRASRNTFDGFVVLGANNTLRGNTADSNGDDGFDIRGNQNRIENDKASANGHDGFIVTGNSNSLKGNAASNNVADGFDIRGTGNVLSSNNADRNADVQYWIGPNNVDGRGNKCRGKSFTFGPAGIICP